MNTNQNSLSTKNVQIFETAYPLLISILNEMKELSKKKQDGVLNPFKVKTINKILSKLRLILEKEPSIDFLELLDSEILPSNSDTVLVLVQFTSALEQFKKKYQNKEGGIDFENSFGKKVWNIEK